MVMSLKVGCVDEDIKKTTVNESGYNKVPVDEGLDVEWFGINYETRSFNSVRS